MTGPSAERSVADVLRAAKERISDPEQWTQGCFARTANGRTISPLATNADAWCARGAVYAEAGSTQGIGQTASMVLSEAAPDHESIEPAAAFNDDCSHADVLELFDRAIELAEAAA